MVGYRRRFIGDTGLIEIFSDRINDPFAVFVGTKREAPDGRFGRDRPVILFNEYVQVEMPDRLRVQDRVPGRGVRVVMSGSIGLVLSGPQRTAERVDCRSVSVSLQAACSAAAGPTHRSAPGATRSTVAASHSTDTQKQLTPQEISRIRDLLTNRHRMPRTIGSNR